MSLGLVVDVDGALGLTVLQHPWQTLWRRIGPAQEQRAGVGSVVRTFTRAFPDAPVVYLTAAPQVLIPAIRRALRADGYPPGTLRTPSALPLTWRDGGARHKRDVLKTLLAGPQRWVLFGDDGGHDPALFAHAASRGGVAAIALRHVHQESPDLVARVRQRAGDVPALWALTGQELGPQLTEVLGVERQGITDWFLTAGERGNDATELAPWTEGNAVRALTHGRPYLTALGEAVSATGDGDEVLLAGWRVDADQLLDEDAPAAQALAAAARRGAVVRALLWRSHSPILDYFRDKHADFAGTLAAAGGRVLLDHRVRAFGSHHQKFAVVRHRRRADQDVAFVGGIDVAASRRDDADHRGDAFTRDFAAAYGPVPAWHDAQLELRGPAVRDVEEVFRERWADPTPLVRAPWRVAMDARDGLLRRADPLPAPRPEPPAAGTSAVQLLRTYPRRLQASPFAPSGERSVARGYAKALARAQRLVYVEDQYLWSAEVARVFAAALHRAPHLQLIAVVPRHPDQESPVEVPAAGFGQASAMEMVHRVGGDRVQIFDLEREDGTPIYVHAKLCVVDDVWAAVGSANLNRRSWTNDSELEAAVLDDARDPREPVDPGGRGDGARRFARELRLSLMREHLGRAPEDDADLLDPDDAARTVRSAAAALDGWYEAGERGSRPAGRLRSHAVTAPPPSWARSLVSTLYDAGVDPDGRPLGMRARGTF